MSATEEYEHLVAAEYAHGFVTEIEADTLPPGLDEDVIRAISARKNEPEWLLAWRLAAYRQWLTMPVPRWAAVRHAPIALTGLAVLTGLALYKPVQLAWLVNLLGGFRFVRLLHFAAMCGLLAFIPGHLVMVALHGWNNFAAWSFVMPMPESRTENLS